MGLNEGTQTYYGRLCSKCGGTLRYRSGRSCVVCQQARSIRVRKENPRSYRVYDLRYRRKYPEKYLLAATKVNARRRGIDFNLTLDDIHIPDLCPVLGIPLLFHEKGRTDNTPSIDRIDNSKGYVPGNVGIISWRANRIKNDSTVKELEALVKYLKERSHQ